MSKDQMTAVIISATKHIVGTVFARGNASPKAPPAIENLVGKDGYQVREEDTGDDLFKIPTSELSTALVTFDRAAFTAASLVAPSFTSPGPPTNDRLFYQVVVPPGSKPDAPITNGTAAPITSPSPLNPPMFTILGTGIKVALNSAATVPTGVWVLLWDSHDTVLVASGQIHAGQLETTVPSNPLSIPYRALGLVAGYAPKFKSSVNLNSPF